MAVLRGAVMGTDLLITAITDPDSSWSFWHTQLDTRCTFCTLLA